MQLEQIMSTAFLVPKDDPMKENCRWGLPILLWGPPGIGKSNRIEAGAHAVGLAVETVYAATKQPEDLAGAPIPDGMGDVKVACVLAAARKLMQDQVGVLFIDELSTAAPAVQGAFLSVVLEGRIGDEQLPPGIRIIGAANPPENAAGGWDLEPPMANRFAHFTVTPPIADDWIKWLLEEGGDAVDRIEHGEKRVQDNWSGSWARARGLIAGFMKRKGSSLYALPPEGSPHRGRAWPSPRSWEMAVRSHATCLALGHKDLTNIFLQACVGEGAASEYITWMKEADLPDPVDVLKNGWKINKSRLDLCMAVYVSMAAYVTTRPDRNEQLALALPAWKRLRELQEAGLKDLSIPPVRALVRAKLGLASQVQELKDVSVPVVSELGKAGLGDYVNK